MVVLAWLVWGGIYAIHLSGVKEGATPAQVLRYAYSDAILWALATPLVWWLARRFPVRRPRVASRFLAHALLGPAVARWRCSFSTHCRTSCSSREVPTRGPCGTS